MIRKKSYRILGVMAALMVISTAGASYVQAQEEEQQIVETQPARPLTPMEQIDPVYLEDTGFKAWLNDVFSSKDPRTFPEFNLKAPFHKVDNSDPYQNSDPYNLKSLKRGAGKTINKETDLSVPHRPDSRIAIWLQRAVSETFSFKKGDYSEHLQYLRTGMGEEAIKEYDRFMHSSNLLPNIQNGSFEVQVSIDAKPNLLCRYVEQKRFRWLFDMPLTFTIRNAGQQGYQENEKPRNWNLSIVAQVGRSPVSGADGVMIDHVMIWAANEEWDNLKLLDPSNLPCSWEEVLRMVQ